MRKSGIEWCDYSWNPVVGCTKISAGCRFCYAERLLGKHFSKVRLLPHRLNEPFYIKKPSIILVNAISDFFHEEIPDTFKLQILKIMLKTPQHIYQILTKRSKEMLRFCKDLQLPSNIWLGVSCETPKYLYRVDDLRKVNASVRFISIEPLLAPFEDIDLSGISWVIVGGESGYHLANEKLRAQRGLVDIVNGEFIPYPDKVVWVRRIRDICIKQNVAFFFKQWGGLKHADGGCELDGRKYLELPRQFYELRYSPPSLF